MEMPLDPPEVNEPMALMTLPAVCASELAEAFSLSRRLIYAEGAATAAGLNVGAAAIKEASTRVLRSQTTINKLRFDLDNAVRKLRKIMDMVPTIVGGEDDDEWKRGWDEGYSEAADFAAMTARQGLPEPSNDNNP